MKNHYTIKAYYKLARQYIGYFYTVQTSLSMKYNQLQTNSLPEFECMIWSDIKYTAITMAKTLEIAKTKDAKQKLLEVLK